MGGQGGPSLLPPVPCNPGSYPFFLGFLLLKITMSIYQRQKGIIKNFKYLLLWFEGNIRDRKKAPNLAEMLFQDIENKFRRVPNDPIIRGRQDKHFIFSTFCKLEIEIYLLFID